jgi:hypothetical protein
MVESTREYLRRRERELGEEIAKFEAERAAKAVDVENAAGLFS